MPTEAVKKWRQHLLGRKFLIRTDQRSLRALLDQVIQTPKQQKYLTKLLGYEYAIVYKPGRENRGLMPCLDNRMMIKLDF